MKTEVMKWKLMVILVCGFTLHLCFASDPGQTPAKQKVKGDSSRFTGIWRGSENCKSASAAVAIISIADGPSDLTISGIYSIQGKVNATIRGNAIIIPRQEVRDPNFKHLIIEGELNLSVATAAISGTIKVLNNDSRDECSVQYHK